MKKLFFMLAGLFVFYVFSVQAGMVPAGSRIYVVPMENGLDGFITAEMMKQKLPVDITTSDKSADYVLVGSAVSKGSATKWFDVVFGTAGTRDSMQATVKLLKKDDQTITWANSQGDRSVMWGMLKKHGERKVAQRIVKAMKRDLFAK